MSVFLLPATLEDNLQKMMSSFWWGSKNNFRGIHWMCWDRLTMERDFGGMRFRNLQAFNLSILGKQG